MLQLKSHSKRLLSIYNELDAQAQQSLLDFAEFLQSRAATESQSSALQQPQLIPAKEGESVIQAVKRLSASYPMLDRAKLLNDTSVLVTEHTLQGRAREEVIEELELVFSRHYQLYSGAGDDNNE